VLTKVGGQGTYWIAGELTFGPVCVLVDGAAVAGADPGLTGVVTVAAFAITAQAATKSREIETILYRKRFIDPP
jgi:hypothetical protein